MKKDSKIYIAGDTGLVGSAFVKVLNETGYNNLIVKSHSELDLTRQSDVEDFFREEKPEYVIDVAAKVGGIKANMESPADFYYENMMIQNNVIWSSYKMGVKKLLFLGSACQYPKECEQPIKEEYLLNGLPEVTNEGYALAKIGGCRLCSYIRKQYGADFISAIPANTYGDNDCFDPEKSHVIPALIMKYHNAKINNQQFVELWGTGSAKREFIYVDDIADAGVFLLNNYSSDLTINIGTGTEISILELSELISKIVGYEGKIVCDTSKPDGMMRRILDSSRINALGWKSKISLEVGLRKVYEKYIEDRGV